MAEGGSSELAKQKKIIQEFMSLSLKKGDPWCLVDIRWFKQWKKYVGFDQWDSSSVGSQDAQPGPVDNSELFKPDTNILREHLVDDLDYVLMPEEAYKKLVSWYDQAPDQEAIVRKVVEQGMFMKHCKVEVYLMELKLCENSDITTVVTRSFSRASTIASIEQEMRQIFNIPEEKETRLWNRYMSNTFEMLSKKDVTLQDAGLYQGQVIVIEVQKDDGTWPRQHASNTYGIANRSAGYGGASASQSQDANNQGTSTSSSSVSSYHNGYDRNSNKPGICGLANLGNTCFMNSALQCMSNVSLLTGYMLSNQWEKELNRENPLGMRGEIAISYNELIRDIWSGLRSYTIPKNFKIAVGRFAPQFSGYQQQDSQELMAFLLDGLHEDLNRIRKKPYIELKDSGGRPDKVVAKEAWDNYKKRNDSVIVDIFHGLLKSTVQCPDCKKISVTFDPFCYLSLPLPIKKERQIEVIWVPLAAEKKPKQLKLNVSMTGSVRDLCSALSTHVDATPDKMLVADVYNHRFHRVFKMDDGVNHILDRDDIFVYEIPVSDVEDPNVLILPVYFRNRKYSLHSSDHNSVYSQLFFSHPLLLAVPRHSCNYEKLYQLLLQRMSRYVQVPENLDDWKDESLAEDVEAGQSSEKINSSTVENINETLEVDDDAKVTKAGSDLSEEADENITSNKNDTEPAPNSSSTLQAKSKKIFRLTVTNNFGRDEADTVLVDDGKPLKLTSKNYIAVDWSKAAKERFFNEKAAEDFDEHESMRMQCIQKRTVIQLDDCLKLFMKEEQLSIKDPWFCPDCKLHKQASKKFDLWSLPDVLIIHLKRFSYNRNWGDKIELLLEFPIQGLDLRKYIINKDSPDRDLYDLIAVTNHYGGLGGGHYTAYAMNKDDNNWYYFDDSNVTLSSPDSVVTNAAYVLVYQRKDVKQNRSAHVEGSHTGRKSKTHTSNSSSTTFNDQSIPNGVGAASEEDDMEVN